MNTGNSVAAGWLLLGIAGFGAWYIVRKDVMKERAKRDAGVEERYRQEEEEAEQYERSKKKLNPPTPSDTKSSNSSSKH